MVGTRRALEGTPYEVIALAPTKLMGTLADYQRSAIMGLGALLVATLVWTVLMGSGKRSGDAAAESGGDTLGSACDGGHARAAAGSGRAALRRASARHPPGP